MPVSTNPLDELRAVIEARWEPLSAAIKRLTPERLKSPTTPEWSAKESIAHVAFWDEAAYGFMILTYFNQPLPDGWTFGSGWLPGDDPWPHFDVHNAREAAWAREQSTGDVIARFERAHEQLLSMLPNLTPELIHEKRGHLAEISQHYITHREELERAAG